MKCFRISIFQAGNVKLIHLTNFTEKLCCVRLPWIQSKFLECRPFEKKFKFFIWTMRAEFELLWNSHFKDTILNPLVFHISQFTFGASIKYIHSEGEGGDQGKNVHVLLLWRHSIVWKRTTWEGCLKITKFERTYYMDGPISNSLGVRIREILLY